MKKQKSISNPFWIRRSKKWVEVYRTEIMANRRAGIPYYAFCSRHFTRITGLKIKDNSITKVMLVTLGNKSVTQ